MFDAVVSKSFEISPTYVNVFGAVARWTDDHDWEHNFNGWFRRGQSRVFQPYVPCDLARQLEDTILLAQDMGIADKVAMIVISPPTAAGLYVERVLTDSDFARVSHAGPCYFDIPDILFGDIGTPMLLRVVQDPSGYLAVTETIGGFFCCGAADATGALL